MFSSKFSEGFGYKLNMEVKNIKVVITYETTTGKIMTSTHEVRAIGFKEAIKEAKKDYFNSSILSVCASEI